MNSTLARLLPWGSLKWMLKAGSQESIFCLPASSRRSAQPHFCPGARAEMCPGRLAKFGLRLQTFRHVLQFFNTSSRAFLAATCVTRPTCCVREPIQQPKLKPESARPMPPDFAKLTEAP
jgi:hypothetical protein